MQANMIDLSSLNSTEEIIRRDNIITNILSYLNGGSKIIYIEGEDGIGRTTLVRLIHEKQKQNSMLLELDSRSLYGSDIETVKFNMYDSLHKFYYKTDYSSDEELSEGALPWLLNKCHNRLKNKNNSYYIIVDGLSDIKNEDAEKIIYHLPLSKTFKNFKIIVTGSKDGCNRFKDYDGFQPYPLPGFSDYETKKFFTGYTINDDILSDIHLTSVGNPGYLASIRRRLNSGEKAEQIAAKLPDNLPRALVEEWNNANITDPQLCNILSLVASGMNVIKVDILAEIFRMEVSTIVNSLNKYRFVLINEDRIEFISEPFRKFIDKKLEDYKSDSLSAFAEYLNDRPDIAEAIGGIPKFFYEAGDYDKALAYLDDEVFLKIIRNTNSLKNLKQNTKYGVLSAISTKATEIVIGHSLKASAAESLSKIKVWESELDALMALGMYEDAVSLASMATMVEDRFHAFAQILKHKALNNQDPDHELLEQLRILYDSLDKAALGERAVDMAQDIQIFDPIMAIDLIKSSLGVQDDPNATDIAFARLAMASYASREDPKRAKDTDYGDHIGSPELRNLARSFRIAEKYEDIEEILTSFREIEKINDQIVVIRNWVNANKRRPVALDVSLYGIDLVISSSEYSPNAKVFYDISLPIEDSKDKEKMYEFISKVDSQIKSIKSIGPLEDYYNLCMLLSSGEILTNPTDALNRLKLVYDEVSIESNLILKANVLSRLLNTIGNHASKLKCKECDSLDKECRMAFENVADELLTGTADHYESLKKAITNLCLYSFDYTEHFIDQINTQYSRNWLIDDIIRTLAKRKAESQEFEKGLSMFFKIDTQEVRDPLVINLLNSLLDENNGLELSEELLKIIKEVPQIREYPLRCLALSQLICYQVTNKDSRLGTVEDILDELVETWKLINESWIRIEIGFKIVGKLANYDIDAAHRFLSKTKEERLCTKINSDKSAVTAYVALLITIRAFSGILTKRNDTIEDLENIINNINLMPGDTIKVSLFTDLAHRAHVCDREDIFKKVVDEYLRPTINRYEDCPELYWTMVINASPVLYFSHSKTTLDTLQKFPEDLCENGALKIINSILTKKPAHDPIDRSKVKHRSLTYVDIIDVLEILQLIKRDYKLYQELSELADLYMEHDKEYTSQQKNDVENRIKKIIKKQLPNTKGIQHQGYVIICSAQVIRMFHRNDAEHWNHLIDKANIIPNKADRSLVLGTIYGVMPPNLLQHKILKFEEIENLIDELPTASERTTHYVSLAYHIRRNSDPNAQKLLRKSMATSFESNSGSMNESRHEVLNIAYQISPELAANLASLADEDPARAYLKEDLNRQLNILELKKDLYSPNNSLDKIKDPKDTYPEAAWRQLASLNANLIPASSVEKTFNSIKIAASLPLEDAYPILSCLVENLVVRYKDTDQSKTILRPIFTHLLRSTEIIMAMTNFVAYNESIMPLSPVMTGNETFALIKPGQYGRAKEFFRNWIENYVSGPLFICDQYFSVNDIEWLFLIQSANPELRVTIVTSRKMNKYEDLKLEYINQWRASYDSDPLPITVYLIDSGGKKESFIHDRWCLSESGGLEIGTSFNSLGRQESKMKITPCEEAKEQYTSLMIAIATRTTPGNHERIDVETITIT